MSWEVEAPNVNKLPFHEKVQNGNVRGGTVTGISFQGKETIGCQGKECVTGEEYRKLKEKIT